MAWICGEREKCEWWGCDKHAHTNTSERRANVKGKHTHSHRERVKERWANTHRLSGRIKNGFCYIAYYIIVSFTIRYERTDVPGMRCNTPWWWWRRVHISGSHLFAFADSIFVQHLTHTLCFSLSLCLPSTSSHQPHPSLLPVPSTIHTASLPSAAFIQFVPDLFVAVAFSLLLVYPIILSISARALSYLSFIKRFLNWRKVDCAYVDIVAVRRCRFYFWLEWWCMLLVALNMSLNIYEQSI